MAYMRTFLNNLYDLFYCPTPSCEEKPLTKTELMYFVLMIIALAFLIWLGKQANS